MHPERSCVGTNETRVHSAAVADADGATLHHLLLAPRELSAAWSYLFLASVKGKRKLRSAVNNLLRVICRRYPAAYSARIARRWVERIMSIPPRENMDLAVIGQMQDDTFRMREPKSVREGYNWETRIAPTNILNMFRGILNDMYNTVTAFSSPSLAIFVSRLRRIRHSKLIISTCINPILYN